MATELKGLDGEVYAVARIGSAALGTLMEKPELFSRCILFLALAEGLAVLGFAIAMIPHTAKLTTLGYKSTSDSVNLESDIIGKYVERLLPGRNEGNVSLELLKQNGFA